MCQIIYVILFVVSCMQVFGTISSAMCSVCCPIYLSIFPFLCHSTISSGLNALSAVILQDIIKQYISPNITESRATLASKIIGRLIIFQQIKLNKFSCRKSFFFKLLAYCRFHSVQAISRLAKFNGGDIL